MDIYVNFRPRLTPGVPIYFTVSLYSSLIYPSLLPPPILRYIYWLHITPFITYSSLSHLSFRIYSFYIFYFPSFLFLSFSPFLQSLMDALSSLSYFYHSSFAPHLLFYLYTSRISHQYEFLHLVYPPKLVYLLPRG